MRVQYVGAGLWGLYGHVAEPPRSQSPIEKDLGYSVWVLWADGAKGFIRPDQIQAAKVQS